MAEQYKYIPTEKDRMAVTERIGLLSTLESDRRKPYEVNADAAAYEEDLGGLTNFFDYVRALSHKHILDIGAGNAIGIRQLADGMGKGLTYEATGLIPPQSPVPFPFHTTTGEDLLGVNSATVGGILARYSVAYSANPDMVVDAIDRVLVPGGVFKGSFFRSSEPKPKAVRGLKIYPPGAFNEAFEKRGYDTSYTLSDSVLLSIKPDTTLGSSQISARDLHQCDKYLDFYA